MRGLCHRVAEILLAHDAVAIEDAARAVPRYFHRDRRVYPRTNHVSNRTASKVVERDAALSSGYETDLVAGGGPRLAEVVYGAP